MDVKPGIEVRGPTRGRPVHLRVQMTVKIRCDGLTEEENLDQALDTVLEMLADRDGKNKTYLTRLNLEANPPSY